VIAIAMVWALGLAVLGPASAQPVAYGRQGAPAVAAPITLSPTQADLLRRTLDGAAAHGFEPGVFTPRGGDQGALVAATLRYARAVHSGRLKEASFPYDWGLRPAAYDPAPELARAVSQDRLKGWLDSLPPPYTGYQTLQKGLVRYRKVQEQGGWQSLAAVDLKVGATGPLVEALRARLAMEDPFAPIDTARVPAPTPGAAVGAIPPGTPVYDQALAEAVKRAQRRFGIEPTGVLGLATRTALNVPVERRVEQILANMERWRWLPQELPGHRVQVNIAAAVLTVFDGDNAIMSMRAVTGKPGSETPMLHSRIDSIVLNPPWNVPAGIAAKELFPKGRAYLASAGFKVIATEGGGARLQQQPGPGSALGQVKFDFQNPYAVYLHDTPSKGRFASYSRLASHGCVRLEKPLALARHILAGDAYWTPEQIDASIEAGKTVRAQVADPVDVFLLYWTAYVTPDGGVNFRADPYGWDTLLTERIAAQGPLV
jgi:murein L,D-transpeptidase YcbB/YkuD